jgi:hypothetical protein
MSVPRMTNGVPSEICGVPAQTILVTAGQSAHIRRPPLRDCGPSERGSFRLTVML